LPSQKTRLSRLGFSVPDYSASERLNPTLVVFACVLAILAIHSSYYRRFMVDDAFISLRYSERFSHGLGLTWNDGEVVEGYSNLLWVLGCAALGWLGLDLVVAARVLGFLGTGAAIAAVVWVYRGATARSSLPGLAAGLAIALSGSIAIWTVGGLEQPLIAGLLAWVLALTFAILEAPQPRFLILTFPGLLLGLLVLTRADGAIFTLATCLGLVAARGLNRTTLRLAAGMAVIPAVFLFAHLAFRRAYYHDWLPNAAYAKVSFTGERFIGGCLYVGGGLYLTGLLVPSLLPFVATRRDQAFGRRVRFLGTILLSWLAYVIAIGGDFFPGRRHLVPAIVVLAFLTGVSFTQWILRGRSGRRIAWVSALCLAAYGAGQFLDPKNILARHEVWVWDGEAIGGLLRKAFSTQRPLLAVDPAGCMPYFSRLPSVDMLGINDYYLAHHRPAGFGSGMLGHELGSGAYVLSRNPDLVLFNLPTGNFWPYFRSGREMVRDPRFFATFRPVNFECERPKHLLSLVWVRFEGGAIGIGRDRDLVEVPGVLFSENPASVARLDAEGRIGVAVTRSAPAGLIGLPLGGGTWTLHPESSGGPVTVWVWKTEEGDILGRGRDSVSFTLPDGYDRRVTVAIMTGNPSGAHVREVRLMRARDTQGKSDTDSIAPLGPR
jgi:hypothetical protein